MRHVEIYEWLLRNGTLLICGFFVVVVRRLWLLDYAILLNWLNLTGVNSENFAMSTFLASLNVQ